MRGVHLAYADLTHGPALPDTEDFTGTSGMDKPKKTQLFEQHLEKELLAGHLPDTGALYAFVLQQGFLIKHAMPVLRRLLNERRIHGNISHIEYSSLKKPEPISLIRK